MTGIESTQVGPESLQHVAELARSIFNDLWWVHENYEERDGITEGLSPAEVEHAYTDALADVNQLRALVAGLRDDAHQRAVQAAGGGK